MIFTKQDIDGQDLSSILRRVVKLTDENKNQSTETVNKKPIKTATIPTAQFFIEEKNVRADSNEKPKGILEQSKKLMLRYSPLKLVTGVKSSLQSSQESRKRKASSVSSKSTPSDFKVSKHNV